MKQITTYKGRYELSYAEYGDRKGYPILVQHGLIASIDDGAIFHRLLELNTRLICIARPGYGQSSPYRMRNIAEWGAIVSGLVDELELSQFDVFGISSGAPYSYAIGNRFPDKTRNIFILSGIPALFDAEVQSFWPYPINPGATLPEMQARAHKLFFAGLPEEDLEKNDSRDSMMNNCFGIAQDLLLRSMNWGFRLSSLAINVIMRHSQADEAVPFVTAELTSRLLPCCNLEIKEKDVHFSNEILDDFIITAMAKHYRK